MEAQHDTNTHQRVLFVKNQVESSREPVAITCGPSTFGP